MDLYIYNTNLEGLGVIDTFSSLRWRRKYFEPGEFELHCSATEDNIFLLKEGNIIHRLDRKEAGVIEGINVSGTENGDELSITGRMCSCLLERRIVTPTILFGGNTEDAMRKVVSDNAVTARPIDYLTLGACNNFTAKTSFQVTGKSVISVLTALSKSSNIGFRISLDILNKTLLFETCEGTDRTVNQSNRPYVLFSDEFQNITEPKYTLSDVGYKNFAYIAGEGEGSSRIIVEVDRTNGEPRRELWVDARDLQKGELSDSDYKAQLTQRGLEKLAECAKAESFEATAVNTQNFEYLKDWDLGDIVSFEKWEILLNQRITEVEEVYENGIVTITPVCGTALPETLNLGSEV